MVLNPEGIVAENKRVCLDLDLLRSNICRMRCMSFWKPMSKHLSACVDY